MGLTSRLSASQSRLEASRKVLRIRWMMQVWTVVSGHTFPTTSGRPFEPVADQEEHVLHAAVADVGQHAHPELRALTAGPGPQPQDVLLAGQGDPDRGIDRPVRDLPVADLDHDRVDEDRGVDRVERPGLPGLHLLDDLVGDPGDGLLAAPTRRRSPRSAREISPVVRPLAYSDRTISSTPVSRRCRFLTICGSKVPSRSRGTSISTWPVLSVSTVFGRVPLRTLPDPVGRRPCFS